MRPAEVPEAAGYSKGWRRLEGGPPGRQAAASKLAPGAAHVLAVRDARRSAGERVPVLTRLLGLVLVLIVLSWLVFVFVTGTPYALQQLINGVTLGMIYGLIAVGYTMVYGIIGMINFAHGDVFMVGAFLPLIALLGLAALGITSVPLALALTLVFAAAIAALYGWTVERVAYRPLRGSFRLAPLISAIGMSITLQNYVQVSQGARVKPMEPL